MVIPPNQVLINAMGVGSTSLIIWGRTGPARLYTIEVTADIASLQRTGGRTLSRCRLSVTSTGTSVVLSGEVRDPAMIRKALELAATQGIPVVNNVDAPPAEQILLHVEFAEVSKSTLKEVGGDLVRILNPAQLGEAFDKDKTHEIEALSEGFVTLPVQGDGARLDAIIRALKTTGEFKSLAQPNLVTREGQAASFLAGGEFPFPTIQSGAGNNAVIIRGRSSGSSSTSPPTSPTRGTFVSRWPPRSRRWTSPTDSPSKDSTSRAFWPGGSRPTWSSARVRPWPSVA